jgi:hypothetical protein
MNVMLALTSLWLLTAWLFRNRWAGPLILNIGESLEIRRIVLVLNLGLILEQFFRTILPKLRSHQSPEFSDLALFWMIASLALLWLSTRQEIRRDGFIKLGWLIRWGRIAFWVWEVDDEDRGPMSLSLGGPPRKPILALHLHHAVKFLPNVRLRIPEGQKEQVEAILVRQLGPWPAGT